LPDELSQFSEVLDRIETIRLSASVAMGVAENPYQASRIPGIPKIVIVSCPTDNVTLSAETIGKSDCDLVIRVISVGQPHQAIPVTGALCTAVAGRIEGTLVNELTKTRSTTQSIRIAHPSGISNVDADVVQQENDWYARSASINRTARRLMDGHVYVSTSNLTTNDE
jgi:2-methylaconitate cis-trans-isomerase PrpF